MLRHSRRLMSLTMSLIAIGCSGDAIGPVASPAGTYSLATINDKAPPVVIAKTSDRTVELLASTLVLGDDQRFSYTARTRTTTPGVSTEETLASSGGWSMRGPLIDIAPDDPGVLSASVVSWDPEGKMITYVDRSGSVSVRIVWRR